MRDDYYRTKMQLAARVLIAAKPYVAEIPKPVVEAGGELPDQRHLL